MKQLSLIVFIIFWISTGLLSLSGDPSYSNQTATQNLVQIAFTQVENGQPLIYLVNLDGTDLRRLTTRDSQVFGEIDPNWSPDGSRIFFLSNWHGGGIYAADVGGETEDALIIENLPNYPSSIRLSPDGNKIAFVTLSEPDVLSLYVLNVDGSNLRELHSTTCNCTGGTIPVWSPDSNFLLLESFDNNYQIDLVSVDGSEVRRLTNDMLGGFLASWSPTDNRIAFIDHQESNREIFVANLDTLSRLQLTSNEIDEYQPIWSPDGRKIAFTDGNNVYLMNSDGSSLTQILSIYDYIYSEYEHYAGQFSRASITAVKWLPSGNGLIFNFSIYGLSTDIGLETESLLSWIDISCIQETEECSGQNLMLITTVEGEIGQFEVSQSYP